MGKPRLTPRAVRVLDRIDQYIRQYDIKGESLPHAASDVLDGLAWRSDPEIALLCKRSLLVTVPCGDEGRTWHLTDRAISALWPHRQSLPVPR